MRYGPRCNRCSTASPPPTRPTASVTADTRYDRTEDALVSPRWSTREFPNSSAPGDQIPFAVRRLPSGGWSSRAVPPTWSRPLPLSLLALRCVRDRRRALAATATPLRSAPPRAFAIEHRPPRHVACLPRVAANLPPFRL